MDSKDNLPKLIKDMEEVILASSGADPFEEVLKILSIKLFSEKEGIVIDNPNQIFQKVKKTRPDIFLQKSDIEISDNALFRILKKLENTSLLNTKLEIIDSAFEYLLPKKAKGNRGQYFTPRHIIDLIIEILEPKINDKILDPACGSGGFLLHSALFVKSDKNLYGIDFDKQMQRVAKIMMLMTGFGSIKIVNSDALKLSDEISIKENYFDVIMTNPPFGGEVKDQKILENYELAFDKNGVLKKSVERHILFIEKIVKLLKPGGRACVVLPQGVLNNTNLNLVREWIYKKCRVLGVISLDTNTFKPFTNVKTSLLFIQKWKGETPPDYRVFMAVSKKSGKNNSGKLILRNNKNLVSIDTDLDRIKDNFKTFIKNESIRF